MQWFRKAAEHEIPEAQFKLGLMHRNNRRVGKDKIENGKEALKLFRRAAYGGHTEALTIVKDFDILTKGNFLF